MSELKPCPFCGSENIAVGSDKGTVYRRNTAFGDLTRSVPTVRWAYCVDCGCVAPAEKVNNFDGFYKPDEQEDALNRAISAWNRRAQPAACEIAEYAEDCKDCGFCAQLANEPLIDVCAMLEQAAQDMDDKCRQWQCVLQRVHDAGTFDQNSGLWVGVDKEREAKAQASFEAYRYALGVIDKIAEHVSNPYKFAHKPGGEQDG